MKEIISITGDIGSGKGALSKLLVKALQYDFLSTGNILRGIAKEMGISILELNQLAKTSPEIDKQADGRLMDIEKTGEKIIVDSRLGWHFIPSSFKVYLSVSVETAAQRILADDQRQAEVARDLKEVCAKIQDRRKLELERFKELYSADCLEYSNYDLVIQTDDLSPEEVCELVLNAYSEWKNNKAYMPILFLSPKRLYPTEHVVNLARDEAKDVFESIKAEGFLLEYPIELVVYKGQFFIWDGHKRCSGALLNKLAVIPAVIRASEVSPLIMPGLTINEFVQSTMNKSWYYDWEDCHDFRFSSYPEES